MDYNILVINPGSTSTKIALYNNLEQVFKADIKHPLEELNEFDSVASQQNFRMKMIINTLSEYGMNFLALRAVVGRGGFMKPVRSGTYLVSDEMVWDLRHPWNEHAANLGGLIARSIGDTYGIPAFTVDPVVVDEREPVACVSGLCGVDKKSMSHALSQKATARRLARDLNRNYDDLNLIIAHLGGGITVGAHRCGRIIDINNGLDGSGPFAAERSGTLPLGEIIKMCYSGRYTQREIYQKVSGRGGLVSYFGTNDVKTIEELAQKNDKQAALVLDAMAYQVAREIGACSATLCGKVDAIGLTGGIAFSHTITEAISTRVKSIAPIYIYPGENEMDSLAAGAYRVLNGLEKALDYGETSSGESAISPLKVETCKSSVSEKRLA